MCARLIYLMSVVLLLSVIGNVQAGTVYWGDGGNGHLWSTQENWEGWVLPTAADIAEISKIPGPIVANEGAVAQRIFCGRGGNGELTVDGGTLTVNGPFVLARSAGIEGTVNMFNGSVMGTGNMSVGYLGTGLLKMTGGTITLSGDYNIGVNADSIGHVDLHGGLIIANNLFMRINPGAAGTMDVGGGTLVLNGDKAETVQGYIDDGWITAYNGNGTFELDYNVTNAEQTTLKAVHFLTPNPVDGSSVSVTVNQLQWTLPEPNEPGGIVTCDVYFGTDPQVELNPKVVVGQAVESVAVTLDSDTTYYWALDLYDSSISTTEAYMYCPIFVFNTKNVAPMVNAGADVTTWLADGTRTGVLDGTVTDDGTVDPYTVAWTVVSEPSEGAAVIESATAEDTNITLSAVGEYVLQLEAFDGEFTVADTVTIDAYNDACEAAKSLPGYVALVGDLNGDCRVDDVDKALLEENWLQDNSLVEEWFTGE